MWKKMKKMIIIIIRRSANVYSYPDFLNLPRDIIIEFCGRNIIIAFTLSGRFCRGAKKNGQKVVWPKRFEQIEKKKKTRKMTRKSDKSSTQFGAYK